MKASFELCKLFRNTGEPKDLPKKHTLLQQGEISKHAYFVESGCLRLWYNDEGNDVSVKFFLTGELVASLVSFYLEQPSKFGIEPIRDILSFELLDKPSLDSELQSTESLPLLCSCGFCYIRRLN